MTEYQDEDWPEAPDHEQPPSGKYLLSYARSRRVVRFNRNKIEMDFVIVEPARWAKKVVTMYFAAPDSGPISPSSKYFEVWCLAHGGKPKRGDRMTPQVFHGYWWAELGHTKRKAGRDGKLRELEAYELPRLVVLSLIERAAGAPLLSSRRGSKGTPRMN